MSRTLKSLRRFTVLSPQITLLGIIAVLLSLAMGFLAISIFQQDRANRATLGYNYSDSNRIFSDLDRALLYIRGLAAADVSRYDATVVQNRRDVLTSRWDVLFWPTIQNVLPQESIDTINALKPYWETLQPLMDSWQADPTDVTVRDDIIQTVDSFEFDVNKAQIRYTSLRAVTVSQISDTSEGLLLALGVVSLLIIGFVGLAAFSIHRFVRDIRAAEAKTRDARAAEAAALENSKFKDQFLAVMSHELRTPLNAMIGFLGIMAMSGSLDDKNDHMVQRTRANAERLLALINDILDLSKLESGRMELVPTVVYPHELAQQWRYQMDVLAKQKNLAFTVKIDDSLPRKVEVDEGALTKIVTNLLSNAFKFTKEGEVSLNMRAQNQQWIIEVKDSGIGIPVHMHDAIFESFRQVDNSFKRPYGGTGLGLSIIQHLVKSMEGSVRLESVVGKGSTFIVTLPLRTPDKSTVPSELAAQPV